GAHRLRRAKPHRFIENDPAVHPPPLSGCDADCQFAGATFASAVSFVLSRSAFEGGGSAFTKETSGQRSPRTRRVAKRSRRACPRVSKPIACAKSTSRQIPANSP